MMRLKASPRRTDEAEFMPLPLDSFCRLLAVITCIGHFVTSMRYDAASTETECSE